MLIQSKILKKKSKQLLKYEVVRLKPLKNSAIPHICSQNMRTRASHFQFLEMFCMRKSPLP